MRRPCYLSEAPRMTVESITRWLSTQLPLLAAVLGINSGACYDACDDYGALRCNGQMVEQCGYSGPQYPAWDAVVDCEDLGAACSSSPYDLVRTLCAYPEHICPEDVKTICVTDKIVGFCHAAGEPARHSHRCPDGCLQQGDAARCIPRPFSERDSG